MNTAPKIRSRIAPTPSGFLHLGNLANFLLIEKLVAESGGDLLLRIDDCDGTRARAEFVEHIFTALNWLGIKWTEGPRDALDFEPNFSQTRRKDFYFRKLVALSTFTYACSCSRKDVPGIYPGICREKGLEFIPGQHALRLRIDDPVLAAKFGDALLWRKDDGPAYHWVSVIDDLEMRVNLIVRGKDLEDSSDLQKYIASLVSPGGFSDVRFLHHPLLLGEDGKKLSKSQKAPSFQELVDSGVSQGELRARIGAILRRWNM